MKRAPEVKVEDLPCRIWSRNGSVKVPLGTLAFAWGVAWMLREVELSKTKWGHVSADEARRTVRLFIPHSKADQQGLGVARTLQCCGGRPCWQGCAWALWKSIRKLGDGRYADAPLFPNLKGRAPTKKEMVDTWKDLFGVEVAGHSA